VSAHLNNDNGAYDGADGACQTDVLAGAHTGNAWGSDLLQLQEPSHELATSAAHLLRGSHRCGLAVVLVILAVAAGKRSSGRVL